jgi:hypothetical protein
MLLKINERHSQISNCFTAKPPRHAKIAKKVWQAKMKRDSRIELRKDVASIFCLANFAGLGVLAVSANPTPET